MIKTIKNYLYDRMKHCRTVSVQDWRIKYSHSQSELTTSGNFNFKLFYKQIYINIVYTPSWSFISLNKFSAILIELRFVGRRPIGRSMGWIKYVCLPFNFLNSASWSSAQIVKMAKWHLCISSEFSIYSKLSKPNPVKLTLNCV